MSQGRGRGATLQTEPVRSSLCTRTKITQLSRDAEQIATILFKTKSSEISCLPSPVNEYLVESEAAMTKAESGEFLFDDLRELAASHAQQRVEFEKLIPENISLGLFVVSFLMYRFTVTFSILICPSRNHP